MAITVLTGKDFYFRSGDYYKFRDYIEEINRLSSEVDQICLEVHDHPENLKCLLAQRKIEHVLAVIKCFKDSLRNYVSSQRNLPMMTVTLNRAVLDIFNCKEFIRFESDKLQLITENQKYSQALDQECKIEKKINKSSRFSFACGARN